MQVADGGPVSPRIKQRDAARTRGAILAAAIRAFATCGYAGVGVREIAAAAGVNAALVGRYFGSKEGLFEAAFAQALDLSRLFEVERSAFGANAAKIFLETRDEPSPLAMMILSAGDPAARDICARGMQSGVVEPLARWLGRPDAEARALQLIILWGGFLTAWQLVGLAPLQRAEPLDAASRWLATATQVVVDQAAPASERSPSMPLQAGGPDDGPFLVEEMS